MNCLRTLRAGVRPARNFVGTSGIAAALLLAAVPSPALAAAPSGATAAQPLPADRGGTAITDFYRARQGRPLWLSPAAGQAPQALIGLLDSARSDGLDPERYRPRQISRALWAARSGDIRAIHRAETMLSEAFVAYASDLRQAPNLGIKYVDRELIPRAPSARALLEQAAASGSLPEFVAGLGWMHPIYGQLRSAIRNRGYASESERQLLALNLERARALPAPSGRYIIVNAPAQRLTMYENGEVVDSMRVVVGKPNQPTPMMAALIRYTSLNPYWNVPPDLAAERIAPHVVRGGPAYLRKNGYQLLSDWSDRPEIADPGLVDWKAVADGRTQVRIRQLPGPNNGMGQMKFMFPNDEGIYLHDTPDKQLLEEASRLFSGGCVRLEDAPRLARWLHGAPLKPEGSSPEQRVPLPAPVAVYLTYLTAIPSGSELAYFDDIYGRDAARLAQLRSGTTTAGLNR